MFCEFWPFGTYDPDKRISNVSFEKPFRRNVRIPGKVIEVPLESISKILTLSVKAKKNTNQKDTKEPF